MRVGESNAEIELSVLARQGLAHNITTIEELWKPSSELAGSSEPCSVGTVNWQFRPADARIKLKRLYPVQQPDSRFPADMVACDNLT
jgi:hypothetical protein